MGAIEDAITYLERRKVEIDRLIGELHLFMANGTAFAQPIIKPEPIVVVPPKVNGAKNVKMAAHRSVTPHRGRPEIPVAERRAMIMTALTSGPKMMRDLCASCDLTHLEARWTIMRLRDEKMIRLLGSGKRAFWEIVPQTPTLVPQPSDDLGSVS